MNLVKGYLLNFLNRSGSYVFLASVIARVFSFLASWFALQFIENKALGEVLFAYNIIAFLIPISGLGLYQSLIRYGALLKNSADKDRLFFYVLKNGTIASLGLILLIILVANLISFQFESTPKYLFYFSFLLIPAYIFELIRIQFRINHNNKLFAFSEIIYCTVLLLSVIILSYFYKENGYIIALIITPIIASLFFIKNIPFNLKIKTKLDIINFEFWKYGFFASLSGVVSHLLMIIDILLIGILLNDPQIVTDYKYVSLIPFSLIFLPRVFMATDFVAFTEKIFDKKYIYNYIKSYMLLFFLISIFIWSFSYFFNETILSFFDTNFIKYKKAFIILIFGICGIFIFRGLFGNLLSSISKAIVNFYIASIALILNVITNYYLIPIYGVTGAAITTAVLMWFTGIASAICFFFLYKKINA